MKQKVAVIDPLGSHGSSHHFYLFGQISGLSNNDVNISLYTNNKTDNPFIQGVKFYDFYKDIFSSRFKILSGFRWLIGTIRSIFHARLSGVTVFHFHVFETNLLTLFNVILARILLGKVTLTIHDVYSFSNPRSSGSRTSQRRASIMITLIYALTDLILTHNKFSKMEISKSNPNIISRIHIVPHGNYTPFITIQKDKEKSREHLDLPTKKTILLFFGMIKKVKGLEVLLKALRKVVDTNPDTVLLIAGKPWKNNFKFYQQIIAENDLSENIILHTKFIAHKEVAYYYSASDLVILPYKKIYQSGVLMMTWSYERPALASDLPPFKEVITDNENGFLFSSEDVDDLASRLNQILSNKDNLEKVRVNGNRLINKRFGWDEIGRLTKEAYQTL
jgi:glycosyltransferase involved in cell wall biosynthesis